MTGDERDRILGLLSAGPATVARLVDGLGLPGGVVSYQLKLLERDGLVRVGTMRTEQGAATEVWVSTAAAAPPPLLIPDPLPGLTWTGDGPYPAPLWTAPQPPELGPALDEIAAGNRTRTAPVPAAQARDAGRPISEPVPADEPRSAGEQRAGESRSAAGPGPADDPAEHEPRPVEIRTDPGARPGAEGWAGVDWAGEPRYSGARPPSSPGPAPQPRRPVPADAEPGRGPRLAEVRRVPIDDATFYEFAGRLDALAREFAARATPGAPVTELTIVLTRPTGDGAGYGS